MLRSRRNRHSQVLAADIARQTYQPMVGEWSVPAGWLRMALERNRCDAALGRRLRDACSGSGASVRRRRKQPLTLWLSLATAALRIAGAAPGCSQRPLGFRFVRCLPARANDLTWSSA